MKPLRLLAIIEAHSVTGPAKNLIEFAGLASSLGIETHIATFVRGEDTNLFIETARRAAIPVHLIQERGPYDRATLHALAGLVARLQPDVIQTHAVKSHFLTRLAGLAQRTPWVAFHHGYTWTSWRARIYNQLDRWSLRAAAKVLTVSLPFRSELQEKGVRGERIEIVHNAIRPDWGATARTPENAAATRAELQIPPDRKVILIVGRLSLEKDHCTLLRAISLIESPVRPHLLIVGEGPERHRIEAEIKRLDLGDTVTLTGLQSAVEPYYGIADVAVLSSLTEGSPNALLEAMAVGVPVVATRVGGIPEIVTDGESALLVPPRDSERMAEAIGKLLADDLVLGKILATRSTELIRERHAPEARVRQLVAIYRNVARA